MKDYFSQFRLVEVQQTFYKMPKLETALRWWRKVTVHSMIPVIVTQAMALAFPDKPRNCVG